MANRTFTIVCAWDGARVEVDDVPPECTPRQVIQQLVQNQHIPQLIEERTYVLSVDGGEKLRDEQEFHTSTATSGATLRLSVEAAPGAARSGFAPAALDGVVHILRGMFHKQKGHLDRAIRECDTAVRLDPCNANAYDVRGSSYSGLGDHARGLKDLDTAVHLDPCCGRFYLHRGEIYWKLRLGPRAVKDFDTALSIDPDLAAAYLNRGELHTLAGRYEMALEDYSRFIDLMPGEARGYFCRGVIHWQLRQYQAGRKDFDRCCELDHRIQPEVTRYIENMSDAAPGSRPSNAR